MTVKLNCLQLLIKVMKELNGRNNFFCSHLARSLNFSPELRSIDWRQFHGYDEQHTVQFGYVLESNKKKVLNCLSSHPSSIFND